MHPQVRPLIAAMAKSLSELQRMDATQLNRLTKEVLIASIQQALLDANQAGQAPVHQELKACMDAVVAPLLEELRALRTTLTAQLEESNKKIDNLEQRISKQDEIIEKQNEVLRNHQREMERADQKERETNLIVLGVPDTHESLDGATSDDNKVAKVWSAAGVNVPIKSSRRLGRARSPAAGGRGDAPARPCCRPLLVTVASREQRDEVLQSGRQLKEAGPPYDRIYIKKDVHPDVRKEWGRLRQAERRERERPENQGCNIRLNTRERILYKDDMAIDQWSVRHFL